MRIPKAIDMSRPSLLYAGMIAALLLAVFVEGRSGWRLLTMPSVFFRYQQGASALLFLLSAAAGLVAAKRHTARELDPWRVPQSQVMWTFLLFFILGAAAVLLSV